jgi:hypothetical protein
MRLQAVHRHRRFFKTSGGITRRQVYLHAPVSVNGYCPAATGTGTAAVDTVCRLMRNREPLPYSELGTSAVVSATAAEKAPSVSGVPSLASVPELLGKAVIICPVVMAFAEMRTSTVVSLFVSFS